MPLTSGHPFQPAGASAPSPVMLCVLGSVQLLKMGEVITFRSNSKTELLLSMFALYPDHAVPRERLLDALWPSVETVNASQSLHSLVYSLNKLLGDALGDATPVAFVDGCYRLSEHVAVDATLFDRLAGEGDRLARAGDLSAALARHEQAVALYRGDLCSGADIDAVIERERLRALYLSLLARLARSYLDDGNLDAAIGHALTLLRVDACREDAHRLIMRAYIRRGERAQALRQYAICEFVLRNEYGATPEQATLDLFDQARLDPGAV